MPSKKPSLKLGGIPKSLMVSTVEECQPVWERPPIKRPKLYTLPRDIPVVLSKPSKTRLWPASMKGASFSSETEPGKFKNRRKLKKILEQQINREKATSDEPNVSNNIDTCEKCHVPRMTNRELAITACPKCGHRKKFASYIFDWKEQSINRGSALSFQAYASASSAKNVDTSRGSMGINHMKQFCMQFKRGFQHIPVELLGFVSHAAGGSVHVHDAQKIQTSKLQQVLAKIPGIPTCLKRAPDRISKELRGEAIPEFSEQEMNVLMDHRSKLAIEQAEERSKKRKAETPPEEEESPPKISTNLSFLRTQGRALGYEIANLFPRPKTKITL